MVAAFHPPKPPPADPLGQRLYEIFGQNLWDFIEAPAPNPGEKPQWRTVKKYPLRPRILWQRWQDPDTLIGVRFESQTYYALIDIDATSPYLNLEAIAQLRAALETIGISRILVLRSSHSNGLHLYIPFPEPVKTFDLAVVLTECLTIQEFTIAGGTLETFPNPKPYGVEKIIHYNGHRLPLQPGTGSYLLDDDLNPIGDSLDQFFGQWDLAARQQDLDALRAAMKRARANRRKKTRQRDRLPEGRVIREWREDMEAELSEGWSGSGQTNHLLKTVACYGHVFLGLAGDDLVAHSLETATRLSGYQQYCGHHRDIHHRVKSWCRDVEQRYWPLSENASRKAQPESPPAPNRNQQRSEAARDRIAQAVKTLQALGTLPSKVRERVQRLAEMAHCSFKTIYKHLSLWHPDHTPRSGVTDLPEPDSAIESAANPPISSPKPDSADPPEPLSGGLLHTSERSMKCWAEDAPSSSKNPPLRGVRGEEPRFPQATDPDHLLYDQHYRPLPPPSPAATPEEQERYQNQEALRRCLFRLKWSHQQLAQFIAEQFEGKRFYQLTSEDIVLLIYRLSSGLSDPQNPGKT